MMLHIQVLCAEKPVYWPLNRLLIAAIFLPPRWCHTHEHFGFVHRQPPLLWLKPFLKHCYVKIYELIAPHTLKWNIIHCSSQLKFQDRWLVFFSCDSFWWPNRPRTLAWDQEVTPCKQMETMIIPTSLRSKTLLFSHKIKGAALNYMIRI